MKKINLLFVFVLLITLLANAQNIEPCGTEITTAQKKYLNETKAVRQNFNRSSTISWIPVQVHIITDDNGSFGISAFSVYELMGALNQEFYSANIQFYFCSNPLYIASDQLFVFDYPNEDTMLTNTYDVPNVMNVYFTETINYNGGSACGLAYFPGGPDHMIIDNSCTLDNSTFLHEWGHIFTLYHTHGKSNTTITDELVNGSNCTVAGDDVCDTPADPNLWQNTTSGCAYTAGQTDLNGDVYVPDVSNIMSYAPSGCRNDLSSGQDNRMSYSAVNDRPYLNCNTQPSCANIIPILNSTYSESFENGWNGWENYEDAYVTEYGYSQFDFLINSGGTPTNNTGPSSATDGNNYILAEATNHEPGYFAAIKSPCFDFSNVTQPKMSIKSHQYGTQAGQFVIQASVDGGFTWSLPLFSHTYDRGNQWNLDTIDLIDYANENLVQLRVSVLTYIGDLGDIAFDDVQVWDDNIIICPTAGIPCDDNDSSTYNDLEDGNCNCVGTPCPTTGTSCDDNDPNTENDIEDGFCNCAGTPIQTCTETIISQVSFDSGWEIWNDGGSDCRRSRRDSNFANSGTRCVRLRDNTNTSVMTTDSLDLTAFDDITVDFNYITVSMDNSNEDFWLQISTDGGTNYATVEEWNLNDEFVNNSREFDSVIITGPFSTNTKLRFRCDASGNNDKVYIDDVTISGCQFAYTPVIVNSNYITKEPSNKNTKNINNNAFTFYPNPARNNLNMILNLEKGKYEIQIFSVSGKLVINDTTVSVGEQMTKSIEINSLKKGFYFVVVKGINSYLTGKLVVK